MSEILTVGGLDFQVRRSARRKSLGLTVDRAADLVIHAPDETPPGEISRWVSKKLLWVYRTLALKEQLTPKLSPPEYVSGEAFCYLGRHYRLKVVERQDEPLKFDGARFTLRRDARPADEHFRRWYMATGSGWLKRRIKVMSTRTSTSPRGVQVRDLGFRWGSCGKNGVIFVNWKLLQLPISLADYVIAHELTHLEVPHHNSEFFHALSRVMPDWERRKEALATRVNEYLKFGLNV